MLKSTHADILNKPYSQMKELKLYCPDDLEKIKADHKSAWQIFKDFNLKVYQNLPNDFAKPHIQNWCNGWEIRRHFFAYYKYERYLGNAPIIVVILNKERLIVSLTWHSYKAHLSKSSLSDFNQWINDIDFKEFDDFYFWHSRINEYGDFKKACEFDYDKIDLKQGEFYRLGKFIYKNELNNFNDDELLDWTVSTIEWLSKVYEYCH
ncbi:HI_0552 family protein [Moraxella oblonga]|uniref:HI_0552 family protein n=1 Tax=Moraxella oblonga TaxID=200413 RepID=UPI00082FBA7D|nr:HI_0552 family protein [Moraxella oblonga]